MTRECDYYSKGGMNPEFWGPGTWTMIHVVAANNPCQPTREDRDKALAFIHSLGAVLPCGSCRAHFAKLIGESFPLTPGVLKNRFSFFTWSVRVHNAVNRRLGKRVYSNPDEWFKMYDKYRHHAA